PRDVVDREKEGERPRRTDQEADGGGLDRRLAERGVERHSLHTRADGEEKRVERGERGRFSDGHDAHTDADNDDDAEPEGGDGGTRRTPAFQRVRARSRRLLVSREVYGDSKAQRHHAASHEAADEQRADR